MSIDAKVTSWDSEEIPQRLWGERRARLRRIAQRPWIHVTALKDSLRFSVYPDGEDVGESPLPDISDIHERCSSLLYTLLGSRDLDDAGRESAWTHLEALGSRLFQRLLPPELQEIVRRWPDQTFLGISTNESWIPWELLHDGKGFLGHRMLLVRMPRYPSGARKAAVDRLSAESAGPRHKVLNVVGGGLGNRLEECRNLFVDLNGTVEVRLLVEQDVSVLRREIQDADLVHITCHGHRDPLRLQIYKTSDRTRNLQVEIVGMDSFRLKPRCLVYANACNSGAASPLFGDFVGFGWEFYRKGAAAFIGTLGTVPTEEALSFARRFYARLARDPEGDVYQAYQETRNETERTDLACLLLCLYGNFLEELSFRLLARTPASDLPG